MQYITSLKGINSITFCYDDEKLKAKFIQCQNSLEDSSNYELSADTVLLDSFHSATIEGARTTIESVKQSINAPKSKSDIMVVNNMKALDKVYSGFCIDENSIRELWNIVVNGVCENIGVIGTKYRDGEVYISSLDRVVHTPAAHTEIEFYIHPFCDGNGRTARILQNYCLYREGYEGVKKIRISQAINMHLGAYYKVLESVEKPVIVDKKIILDLTAFIDYMLDRILEACKLSEKKQYDLSEQEKKLLVRMSKRGIGAEITVSNAASVMDVSLDKARKILNNLADKEYLFKTKVEGKNKSLYRLLILIS